MYLLSEEIRLEGKKNLSALDLAEVEYQSRHFLGGCAGSISETMQEIAEGCRLINDTLKNLFFLGLERQSCDFGVPILQILKFRTSSIARNLLTPIAYWAGILVKFLYFTPSNLQTFAMVPI